MFTMMELPTSLPHLLNKYYNSLASSIIEMVGSDSGGGEKVARRPWPGLIVYPFAIHFSLRPRLHSRACQLIVCRPWSGLIIWPSAIIFHLHFASTYLLIAILFHTNRYHVVATPYYANLLIGTTRLLSPSCLSLDHSVFAHIYRNADLLIRTSGYCDGEEA